MADKKKIAFIANCCIVGGVETALINLLNVFDTDRYDVTLYTNFAGNPVVGRIPKQIKCVDLDVYNIKYLYNKAIEEHSYIKSLKFIRNYALFKLTRDYYNRTAWLYRHIDFNMEHFDCVIAYNYGTSTLVLAQECFTAHKKVVWAHGDMPYFSKNYINNLCAFDKCFCVSEYMEKYFICHCPEMQNRAEIFYNIANSGDIIQKSEEPLDFDFDDNDYIIVTVGRLGNEKGQINIPETARKLTMLGINFKWYLIGDGIEHQNIENEIKRTGMEENVILLGEKSNPYPYMKKCSIYVQTSLTEGWCLTTQEARILHKPCVVTDIPVMHEQFTDGVNGIIANGTDANALFEGIMRLIYSPELTKQIVANLKAVPQDGVNEIQKLYDYIES